MPTTFQILTLSTPGIAFTNCAATTATLTLFAIVAAFATKNRTGGSSEPAVAAVEVSGGIGLTLISRRSGGKSKSQQHGTDEQALADK